MNMQKPCLENAILHQLWHQWLLAWPSLPLGVLSVLSSLKLFLPQVKLQSLLCALSKNEGPQGRVLFDSLYPVTDSDENLALNYYLILLDICILFFFQLHSRLSFCVHFQWFKYKTPNLVFFLLQCFFHISISPKLKWRLV